MTDQLPSAEVRRARITERIGSASMCWEHVDRAGIFLSDAAAMIADNLVTDVEDWLDTMRREKEAAEAEVKAMRPVLSQYRRLLGFLTERGHPGSECVRSGWISVKNVAQMWDQLDALDSAPSDETEVEE